MTTPINEKTAATKAKEKGAELAEKTKAAARDVAQDAANAATNRAEAAKSSVANEVSDVASALRTAADDMRNGSPQERTLGQIADSLADASDAMRGKDLNTMVQDVSSFARKNPMVFLGGAALLGFAATRFVKASAPSTTDHAQAPGMVNNGDFS